MRWRDFILENLWLKVFALLLATLIWFAVYTHLTGGEAWPLSLMPSDTRKDFQDRPVLVLGLPTDHRTFGVQPAAVKVIISGPSVLLRELTDADVNVFVRVPNLAGVSTEMPLEVSAPKGVSVFKIEPATVRVKAQLGPQ
jgi:hypothetical protein